MGRRLFMYESKVHPPIPPRLFARRVLLHTAIALAVLAFSLALGIVGYEYFEHLAWRDAFLNAAMLMGGMGPVDAPHTDGGKVFAGLYALYAGLVFCNCPAKSIWLNLLAPAGLEPARRMSLKTHVAVPEARQS